MFWLFQSFSRIYSLRWVLMLVVLCLAAGVFSINKVQGKTLTLVAETGSPLIKSAYPLLKCAFDKLAQNYEIIERPWKRAQFKTRDGQYDGFFMASKNETRDSYAVFSYPFITIEWLYIMRKEDKTTPIDAKFNELIFAANQGSARYAWLANKFKAHEISNLAYSTHDPALTLKLLLKGRYDVALENRANFNKTLLDSSMREADFNVFVAQEKQLGIYFSSSFIQNHPKFLTLYNSSMKHCLTKLAISNKQG